MSRINSLFSLVDNFDIICRKQSISSIGSEPLPPAFIDLIDMRDDVARIESNFGFVGYGAKTRSKINTKYFGIIYLRNNLTNSYIDADVPY